MITLEWFVKKIQELTPPHYLPNTLKKMYIGFSGGIDSVVLLDLCCKLIEHNHNYDITAIHINHGLNKDADVWENFCKELCLAKKIKFIAYKVKINLNNKQESIEDLARNARYNIWKTLLREDSALLLAHHANDQAETVLYRLFRGAGIHGLQAMIDVTQYNNSNIIRPLLTITKENINEYALAHNLKYIVDDSNFNEDFARNFIRHKVIPLLETKWPSVVKKINNTAIICKEVNGYIDNDIANQYASFVGTKTNTLSIQKLLSTSEFVRQLVVRSFISKANKKVPSKKHLDLIFAEVIMARIDASPQIKISDYCITRYRDDLYLLAAPYNLKNAEFKVTWNLQDPLKLPNEKTLIVKENNICLESDNGSLDVMNIKSVVVRLGNYGEKAKKIFQQYNIPPWERFFYPVIYNENKLLGIVGLYSCK